MPDPIELLSSYPGLFALCFFCGLGIPLPEDIPQLWAGMRIASGDMQWAPVLAVAATAILLRDCTVFGIGRWLGGRALSHRWALRFIGNSRIDAAKSMIQERGPYAVLIGRFSIGLRVGTFFVAGAMGVSWRDFVKWDGLALLLSVPLLVGAGHVFGQPVVDAVMWAASRAPWVIPVLLVVGAGVWWWRSRTRT